MISLLILIFLYPIYISASKVCAGSFLCVFGSFDSSNNNIIFSVETSYTGWVGLGLGGNGMDGADMYIAWPNSTGGTTLTYRKGGSGGASASNIKSSLSLIPLQINPKNDGFKWGFSFTRPLTSSPLIPITPGVINYIIAGSNNIPSSQNDPNSAIQMHLAATTFQADFSINSNSTLNQGINQPILSNIDKSTVDIIHGLFMFIAWGVAPPVAIFIARFLKDKLGHLWYILHLSIFIGVTGIFTLIGFLFEYLYSSPSFTPNTHQVIGVIMMFGLLFQVSLGFYSNHKWTSDRLGIPIQDKLHWYTGRTLSLLALINIFLGLNAAGSPIVLYVFVVLWVIFVVFGFEYGQRKIGNIHHMASHQPPNTYDDIPPSIPYNNINKTLPDPNFNSLDFLNLYEQNQTPQHKKEMTFRLGKAQLKCNINILI